MKDNKELFLQVMIDGRQAGQTRANTCECDSEMCIFNPEGFCLAPLITGHDPVVTEEGCMTCTPKED